MLAIEIDGSTHDYKPKEDKLRQTKLESLGIRFSRFADLDVKKNIHGILGVIENWILENTRKRMLSNQALSLFSPYYAAVFSNRSNTNLHKDQKEI